MFQVFHVLYILADLGRCLLAYPVIQELATALEKSDFQNSFIWT